MDSDNDDDICILPETNIDVTCDNGASSGSGPFELFSHLSCKVSPEFDLGAYQALQKAYTDVKHRLLQSTAFNQRLNGRIQKLEKMSYDVQDPSLTVDSFDMMDDAALDSHTAIGLYSSSDIHAASVNATKSELKQQLLMSRQMLHSLHEQLQSRTSEHRRELLSLSKQLDWEMKERVRLQSLCSELQVVNGHQMSTLPLVANQCSCSRTAAEKLKVVMCESVKNSAESGLRSKSTEYLFLEVAGMKETIKDLKRTVLTQREIIVNRQVPMSLNYSVSDDPIKKLSNVGPDGQVAIRDGFSGIPKSDIPACAHPSCSDGFYSHSVRRQHLSVDIRSQVSLADCVWIGIPQTQSVVSRSDVDDTGPGSAVSSQTSRLSINSSQHLDAGNAMLSMEAGDPSTGLVSAVGESQCAIVDSIYHHSRCCEAPVVMAIGPTNPPTGASTVPAERYSGGQLPSTSVSAGGRVAASHQSAPSSADGIANPELVISREKPASLTLPCSTPYASFGSVRGDYIGAGSESGLGERGDLRNVHDPAGSLIDRMTTSAGVLPPLDGTAHASGYGAAIPAATVLLHGADGRLTGDDVPVGGCPRREMSPSDAVGDVPEYMERRCPVCLRDFSHRSMDSFQAHAYECADSAVELGRMFEPLTACSMSPNLSKVCPMCQMRFREDGDQKIFEDHVYSHF